MTMMNFLAVGFGGFLGAIGRYGVSRLMMGAAGGGFPVATFAVNLIGCFLIGCLVGASSHQEWLTDRVRLFLVTGVLGGFTTFSAFGLETLQLVKANQIGTAILYVSASLLLGVAAVALGFYAAAMTSRS